MVLPTRAGPEEPGQYSFGDRTRVERILAEAGYHGLAIEPVDLMMTQGKDVADVLERIGDFGPLARAFKEVAPEQIAKAKAAIAEAHHAQHVGELWQRIDENLRRIVERVAGGDEIAERFRQCFR